MRLGFENLRVRVRLRICCWMLGGVGVVEDDLIGSQGQ